MDSAHIRRSVNLLTAHINSVKISSPTLNTKLKNVEHFWKKDTVCMDRDVISYTNMPSLKGWQEMEIQDGSR